jgi:predicted transcriptional regulator YheO
MRRCARKTRAMEEALCALGAFNAKKSKRFVARLLRTDKVFVYFT